jgi:ABC-2 type transport system permease protein
VATRLRRAWNVYRSFAVLEWVWVFQYNAWFWVSILRDIISMVIMTAFWRAIYADTATLEGLTLTTTLNYVILARAVGQANTSSVYWVIAQGISKGELELELLRPVDFQLMHLAREFAAWGLNLLRALPALLIALVFFGAHLPSDPLAYLAFFLTFVLGGVMLYFLEFMLGCLGFYTTELWGLSVLRDGVALFFSGALIPLTLLPAAVRDIAALTPFAQALFVPISFLSGVRDPSSLGNAVLVQLVSIVVLGAVSRFVFSRAVRALTVQGG